MWWWEVRGVIRVCGCGRRSDGNTCTDGRVHVQWPVIELAVKLHVPDSLVESY